VSQTFSKVTVLDSSSAARMRPKRPWPTPKQTR